jgi:hypothetical protein
VQEDAQQQQDKSNDKHGSAPFIDVGISERERLIPNPVKSQSPSMLITVSS